MGSRFWRIRGRDGNGVDQSAVAWARGEVGIWYGAWSADDWHDANIGGAGGAKDFLNALPHQRVLWQVPKTYVDTARRFDGIAATDWVVTFHGDSLHLGRVEGPMRASPSHPLNCGPELFKFRRVVEPKAFALTSLPDSYRLIPPAGRANVFQPRGTNRELLSVLAQCESEEEVERYFRGLSTEEWLDRLSPGEWEALCLGYLIQKENYLPTGLAVGRTLPTVDIVGVNARTGQKILAQCKKAPYAVAPEQAFLSTTEPLLTTGLIYFFAYHGCNGCPDGVHVVGRSEMMDWLDEDMGLQYLKYWRTTASNG